MAACIELIFSSPCISIFYKRNNILESEIANLTTPLLLN